MEKEFDVKFFDKNQLTSVINGAFLLWQGLGSTHIDDADNQSNLKIMNLTASLLELKYERGIEKYYPSVEDVIKQIFGITYDEKYQDKRPTMLVINTIRTLLEQIIDLNNEKLLESKESI